MSDDQQSLNEARKMWADAANRRIQNQQQGNNWGIGPTVDWASEKANDMNVRRWESNVSPNNEKGSEINTTQQRSDDLAKALKSAQDPAAPVQTFNSNAVLSQP